MDDAGVALVVVVVAAGIVSLAGAVVGCLALAVVEVDVADVVVSGLTAI